MTQGAALYSVVVSTEPSGGQPHALREVFTFQHGLWSADTRSAGISSRDVSHAQLDRKPLI